MSVSCEIRSPFRDEARRLPRLVPCGAQTLAWRVAITGRVERIAAGAVLYRSKDAGLNRAHLAFTRSASVPPATILSLIQSLLAEAISDDDIDEVLLVGSIAKDQPLHQLLAEAGWKTHRELDIYRMEMGGLQRRIEPLYRRLLARGTIPAGARIISPQGDWIAKLHRFLEAESPGLSDCVEMGAEGFALEHSLLLVVEDAVQGVLFTRNHGRESFIGLIFVARALRGGFAWANTFLIREVLLDGIASGVEAVVFEVNANDHRGTLQIAKAAGAERLTTRSQFRMRIRRACEHPR